MKNNWKKVWENRKVDISWEAASAEEIFLELKRINGFDVIGDGLTYEALLAQYKQIKEKLLPNCEKNSIQKESVYEVGCGSGANLYLFERDGIQCGGVDYSQNLIKVAKNVLASTDLVCAEAEQMAQEPMYDGVFSNSVFSYFVNEEYAYRVLEKMYKKARYSIGIIDIHDKEKEKAFLTYRKRTIENYERRYKNLPKLFYAKSFFEKFAKEHNMHIVFTKSKVEGYWNNEFVFNSFMYKQGVRNVGI